MNNSVKSMAARRAALAAQCAQQRGELAQEWAALRAPWRFDGLLLAGSHNKLLLAAAGAALGIIAVRPRRLLSLAASALSLLRTAQNILPLLPR
jgi:hypothetical protein